MITTTTPTTTITTTRITLLELGDPFLGQTETKNTGIPLTSYP